MLGYWNKPEATAEMIRNGWLHTGDIAIMDGRVLPDRRPVEGHDPRLGVQRVSHRGRGRALSPSGRVEGVRCRDPRRSHWRASQGLHRPEEGASATAEEIIAWSRDPQQGLTGYRVPHEIEFRDQLPETLIGKVLRRVLQEEERQKLAAGAPAAAPTAS